MHLTKPRQRRLEPEVVLSLRLRTRPRVPASIPSSPRPPKRPKPQTRKSAPKDKAEVIDLTLEDEERPILPDEEEPTPGPDNRVWSPSRPAEPDYTPSAFTPLTRSVLSAVNTRSSVSTAPTRRRTANSPATDRPSLNDDLIIEDDRQSPSLSRVPSPPPRSKTDDGVSKHFEPPALFSASLIPKVLATGEDQSADHIDIGRKSLTELSSRAPIELLLPSHAVLAEEADGASGSANLEGSGERLGSSNGVHVVDEDRPRAVPRYFDLEEPQDEASAFLAAADQSKLCRNCKKPGHIAKVCPHFFCSTCGAMDEHERRDCPLTLVCYGCGERGHRNADCPKAGSGSQRRHRCDRCGTSQHDENSCHLLWRLYTYVSRTERESLLKQKTEARGWAREAIGGDERSDWCYNCAKEGHLGDDCSRPRGSLAKLYHPSAFSSAMANRGPYSHGHPAHGGGGACHDLPAHPAIHSRWEDTEDLPYAFEGFRGEQAGRKSRDKQRRKMQARDRETDRDDGDDWFDQPRGESSISHGGRGGRPGDHEGRSHSTVGASRRNGSLPFGHGHLMSTSGTSSATPARHGGGNVNRGKGVTFGRLHLAADSPATLDSSSSSKPPKKIGNGANILVDRVLRRDLSKNRHLPSGQRQDSITKGPKGVRPPKSKASPMQIKGKGRNMEEGERERDWEAEWRRKGNGGGSVSEWGKELDKEEKMLKKIEKRAAVNGFAAGTVSSGGRGNGQRYTGGY